MAVEVEPVYIFECEFEDGGEWYHLRVDMIFNQRLFYRCWINSIPESLFYIDGVGRLCRSWASQVIIDVTTNEDDQWVDLDFGPYMLVEKLGLLIEKHTL